MQQKQYRQKNKEQLKLKLQQYRQKNKEKIKIQQQKKQAKNQAQRAANKILKQQIKLQTKANKQFDKIITNQKYDTFYQYKKIIKELNNDKLIQRKLYYQKNKENIKLKRKQYYQKNKEQLKIKKREYSKKNKAQIKLRRQQYYLKNRTKILNYKREFRYHNYERIKEQQQKYREQKKNKTNNNSVPNTNAIITSKTTNTFNVTNINNICTTSNKNENKIMKLTPQIATCSNNNDEQPITNFDDLWTSINSHSNFTNYQTSPPTTSSSLITFNKDDEINYQTPLPTVTTYHSNANMTLPITNFDDLWTSINSHSNFTNYQTSPQNASNENERWIAANDNSYCQQQPLASINNPVFNKTTTKLVAKQEPTSTDMNWALFDKTDSIPQTLAAPTTINFNEIPLTQFSTRTTPQNFLSQPTPSSSYTTSNHFFSY